MKRILINVIFIFCSPIFSNAQKEGDKVIVVKYSSDSISAYKLAKKVLIDYNFLIKDEENTNTLNTYPRELKKIPGTCVIRVEIANDTFRVSGIYGTKKMNYWGFDTPPKSFLPIIYFRGSKTWPLMLSIAEKLGEIIRYENPTSNKKNKKANSYSFGVFSDVHSSVFLMNLRL